MKIGNDIRVETIFDYKNGRRFQIFVTNKEPRESFTVHHDMMAREYVKLRLSEADLIALIQAVQIALGMPDSDPKITELRAKKSRLTLISSKDGE